MRSACKEPKLGQMGDLGGHLIEDRVATGHRNSISLPVAARGGIVV